MSQIIPVERAMADPEEVKRLVTLLTTSFQDYVVFSGNDIGYIDIAVALNLFHAHMVIDVQDKMGIKPADVARYQAGVIDSFKRVLDSMQESVQEKK
jgi:hypothetical protein